MSAPMIVAVAPDSPAAVAGLQPGDEIVRVDGQTPRDIIEWQMFTDEADVTLDVLRNGLDLDVTIDKRAGEPLGVEIQSAVFDRVRTCDNHCEFCFIYQLPKGMRRSLYLKDDDYRLSFLYGNFTTLTRFTEADLERVVTERLSPLHVSIHATDLEVRNRMLKNPRGGMSLRWLRALLDHGIEVRGQVVVCPGVNDGDILDDTLAGVLDRYPELASVAVVPLGLSRFNKESAMRLHTPDEADRVVDIIEGWQHTYQAVLGRRMVFAADEYYLMTGRPFPSAEAYEAFDMHEDGIGMARTFQLEFGWREPGCHRCSQRLLRRCRSAGQPGRLHRLAVSEQRRDGRRLLESTPQRPDRRVDRCVRCPGDQPFDRQPRPRRCAGRAGRQSILRRQHGRDRADDR